MTLSKVKKMLASSVIAAGLLGLATPAAHADVTYTGGIVYNLNDVNSKVAGWCRSNGYQYSSILEIQKGTNAYWVTYRCWNQ